MAKRLTVSDYVESEEWIHARETMMNTRICFIGEKYMYKDFPRDEKYQLENLARSIIGEKDKYAWRDLVSLRDRIAGFLHVNVKRSRKAN